MVRVGEVAGSRLRRFGGERFGEAEVEDLEAAIRGDLEVGGLEVAMDDAALVRVLQGIDQLVDEGEDFVLAAEGPAGAAPSTSSMTMARSSTP